MDKIEILALSLLMSWFWCSSALAARALVVADNDQPRIEEQVPQPPQPAPSLSDEAGSRSAQPPSSRPSSETAPQEEKLCEPAVMVQAQCEPTPGSSLSAFPLVLNSVSFEF